MYTYIYIKLNIDEGRDGRNIHMIVNIYLFYHFMIISSFLFLSSFMSGLQISDMKERRLPWKPKVVPIFWSHQLTANLPRQS